MKNATYLLLAVILLLTAFNLNLKAQTLNWHNVGPKNLGGEIRAMLVDKDSANKIFAASDEGGLFISKDYGATWAYSEANNSLASHTIVCIAQAPNGDIYIGTGNSYNYSASNYNGPIGTGIYKSTDGGQTFSVLSSTVPVADNTSDNWAFVNAIAISSTNSQMVYVGTNHGLFCSTDGGNTWTRGNGFASDSTYKCDDVKVGGNGRVHVSMHRRYYHSVDSVDFERYDVTGFPATGISSFTLAVSPSDPNYIYASAINTFNETMGIYKSMDNGLTWSSYSPVNAGPLTITYDDARYAHSMAVSPTNRDSVYVGNNFQMFYGGGTDSTDWVPIINPADSTAGIGGGYTQFAQYFKYTHVIAFDPLNPNYMYIGCDGGVVASHNGTSANRIFKLSNQGLDATECYGIAVLPNKSLVAGMQTTGSGIVDSLGGYSFVTGLTSGIPSISRYHPSNTVINGFFSRLFRSNDGINFNTFLDSHADSAVQADNKAQYLCPLQLWERDANTSILMIGLNNNVLFTFGSNDFSSTPFWYSFPVNGLVTTIRSSSDGVFYIGTYTGALYRVGGLADATYTPGVHDVPSQLIQRIDNGGFASNLDITDVAVDPKNAAHIVVTAVNAGGPSFVYESNNALDTSSVLFANIPSPSPSLPVYTAAINYYDSTNIIIGSENGLWLTNDHGNNWVEQDAGFKGVHVHYLLQAPAADSSCQIIYAATYGRGVWATADLAPSGGTCKLQTGVANFVANDKLQLKVYPNPATDHVEVSLNLVQPTHLVASIIDLNGRVCQQKDFGQQNGQQVLGLQLGRLATGTYLLSVQAGTDIRTQAIVIQR